MKHAFKKDQVEYRIDVEKREVVCEIHNTAQMFADFVEASETVMVCARDYHLLTMPSSFIGRASCSVEDEWRLKVGKLIAYHRAKEALNKSLKKRIKTINKVIMTRLCLLNRYFHNYETKLAANTNRRVMIIENELGDNE